MGVESKSKERFKNITAYISFLGPSQQLLIVLALTTYLFSGLFLSFFSHGFDFDVFYKPAQLIATGRGAEIYQDFFNVDVVRHPAIFGYPAP